MFLLPRERDDMFIVHFKRFRFPKLRVPLVTQPTAHGVISWLSLHHPLGIGAQKIALNANTLATANAVLNFSSLIQWFCIFYQHPLNCSRLTD